MTITVTDRSQALQLVQAAGSINAFKSIAAADDAPLSNTETVTITLSPAYYNDPVGSITDPNGGGTFQNNTFTESGLVGGSPTFATNLLSRLVYQAPGLPNGQSSLVHATVTISDGSVVQTDPTPVSIDVATPPSITGAISNQPVASGNSLRPFGTTDVQDYSYAGNALDSAAITITDGGVATDADGLLTGPGLSKTGTGTYAISATNQWQLDSFLYNLSFASSVLPAGQDHTANFALKVTDANTGLATTNSENSVLILAAPAVPQIAGLPKAQTVTTGVAFNPFGSVSVTDGNAGTQEATNIVITDGNGVATDAIGSFGAQSWLKQIGAGTYTITATSPANLTTELDKLVFNPVASAPGTSSATTNFTLNVANTKSPTPSTASTAVTTAAPVPVKPGAQVDSNFQVQDQTTGQSYSSPGTAYSGPVAGLTTEYVILTSDNINVKASVPNTLTEISFLPGQAQPSIAGIDVSKANGNNVMDSYANSSFLIGGSGTDQFYDDIRTLSANSWSTAEGFHSGDNLTVWGITQSDFTLNWIGDTYGASGATGLTGVFVPTDSSKPEAAITLAGYTTADLSNGRLSFSSNTTGTPYYSIHAN